VIQLWFLGCIACSEFNGFSGLHFLELLQHNLVVEGIQDDLVCLGVVEGSSPLEHAHDDFVAAMLGHKLRDSLDLGYQDFVEGGAELWEFLEAL
jgi:hypothetical protein